MIQFLNTEKEIVPYMAGGTYLTQFHNPMWKFYKVWFVKWFPLDVGAQFVTGCELGTNFYSIMKQQKKF